MTVALGDRIRSRVIPAVPVPFTAHNEVDDELQRLYVEWMAGQHVGAVAVWAHTGRPGGRASMASSGLIPLA